MSEGEVSGGVLARIRASVPDRVLNRVIAITLTLGTGAILGTALWLEASPNGHGTHLQLGLNQCSFLMATGWPCPMCGATTTFTLWAHLHPLQGIVNQPFASLLFLMTVVTFAVSLVESVDPRGRWNRIIARLEPFELPLALGFLALMGISWIYKIWLMG
ncbi:MAG: DUF2752 domain-containing protein [Myxococcota bacterium]